MVAVKNKSAELYSYLEQEESGTEERGEDKKNSCNVRGSKEGGRDRGREGKKKRKEGGKERGRKEEAYKLDILYTVQILGANNI